MERSSRPIAEVISLDDFRDSLRQKRAVTAETQPPPVEFSEVDQASYRAIRRILQRTYGTEVPANIGVLTRDVSSTPHVRASYSEEGWGFAIDRNFDDLESLTIPLETMDDATEQRLREPISRLYTTTILAKHVLQRENRINFTAPISPVQIGREVVSLDPGSERFRDITEWRIASGMGLIAVCRDRLTLKQEIRQHLGEVLEDRLAYARSRQFTSQLLGVEAPDRSPVLPDHLVGICTPLNTEELLSISHIAKDLL